MQIILTIILFTLLSLTALGEGTMSTDDTPASRAEASLSGYDEDMEIEEDEIEAQEEEQFYLDEEETKNIPEQENEKVKEKKE